MTEQVIQLTLRVETDSEADAEEMAMLTADLRELLLELDIESADPLTRGQVPPGSRSGEMFVAGALTVMLARSAGHSPSLLDPCLSRDRSRESSPGQASSGCSPPVMS